jgi:hypothetical protein
MTPLRTALVLLLLSAAIYGTISSNRSYQRLQFHTYVEPDQSLAESYEGELWLKLPLTAASVVASVVAASPLWRRP